MQNRNWCFTDFELLSWGKIYDEYKDIIRYITWGKEICPKTKKEHNQGFIQFYNKRRMGTIKNMIESQKLHLEPCKGTASSNIIYCHKDGDYEERGASVSQGQRTDLEEIKQIIDTEGSMMDVAEHNFGAYCRYRSSFEKYKQMVDQQKRKDFRKVEVIIIKGPTGCGKTRRAVEMSKDTYKIEGGEMAWFDGYNGEKTLVIDEYDNQINCTTLLGILDGYTRKLPIKGGFTYANWDRVIMTTNNDELHTSAKNEHKKALKRRITRVINFFTGA